MKRLIIGGILLSLPVILTKFIETNYRPNINLLGNESSLINSFNDVSIYSDFRTLIWCFSLLSIILLFKKELLMLFNKIKSNMFGLTILLFLVVPGCRKPFEPVQLETISSNEEAILLPYTENVDKQVTSNNEEYLKKNLVYGKQVKIPQQWVQLGYESLFYNGEWRPAAILIKVDKSPVTREWTADPNSGTSNKNEAVWVMTSDQVEFSTGWTCTARIESRDDAIKFLHNYPNGSLQKVLDSEVRGKLQSTFGLEVTDQPMDKLRKEATPHITKTVESVVSFFKERGISITNLGITGGFIYKDDSIMKKMVEVFNAEQERSIAVAKTSAQEETNKKIVLEATSKADALLKEKQAEADSIKLVADAKAYEIEKAEENKEIYIKLKQIELEKAKLEKWNGAFPTYFMGGNSPNLLLNVPIESK